MEIKTSALFFLLIFWSLFWLKIKIKNAYKVKLVPLFIFGRNALAEVGFTGSMFTLIIGVILTNGIMEIVLAGVIGGPIAQRLLDYKEADL